MVGSRELDISVYSQWFLYHGTRHCDRRGAQLSLFGMRAADAARTDGLRVTVMGLMRSLKDPEIQSSVKLMMALLRRLPQIVEEAK